ncbi:olfactory receptor 11A1-like [Mastacembelus armatus]|uniref:olfactory receptor 11A1-like n=1 Tax=Mastacembelus armatus TaxID=205130 RepID=UPI000E453FC4|nr:olfactory receptor 11A1-like [Mastacembelus armatus]
MDYELNLTYLTLDGYVELNQYRFVYFVILFTAYILIICSNSTIVCLIVIHKNLHEPMYIFIAALSLNSVLYSTALYPKILFDVLSEKQIMSYSACLFQYFIIYSLGTSEFLLLAAMSYDRYVSICKPLQYPTIMTTTNVSIFLFLAWFSAACHFAGLTILNAKTKLCNFSFKGVVCNNVMYELHCVRSSVINFYGVVAVVDLIIFPLIFIVFTYIRIFIIAYRSGREVRRKAAETCLPHLMVLISYSCLSVYDLSIARVESNFPKTARLIMTLQTIVYHPLFNPLIYGLKMKEIYKHLKRLFCPARII